MSESFNGWKRKMGIVTLVMACVVAAGWAKSVVSSDALALAVGNAKRQSKHGAEHDVEYGIMFYIVKSEMNTLILSRTCFQTSEEEVINDLQSRYKYPQWESSDNTVVNPVFANAKWQFCGFGFCTSLSDGESFEHHLLIPYWSLDLPLTLISLWLFLSKPRKSNHLRAQTSESKAPSIDPKNVSEFPANTVT